MNFFRYRCKGEAPVTIKALNGAVLGKDRIIIQNAEFGYYVGSVLECIRKQRWRSREQSTKRYPVHQEKGKMV